MYAQFYLSKPHGYDLNQLNFQKCILAGNWLMLISLMMVTAALAMTFAFDQHFSIASQVAGHITTIIFAAFLKIGYVLRCVGVHGLGYKIF